MNVTVLMPFKAYRLLDLLGAADMLSQICKRNLKLVFCEGPTRDGAPWPTMTVYDYIEPYESPGWCLANLIAPAVEYGKYIEILLLERGEWMPRGGWQDTNDDDVTYGGGDEASPDLKFKIAAWLFDLEVGGVLPIHEAFSFHEAEDAIEAIGSARGWEAKHWREIFSEVEHISWTERMQQF
jgi:hypothetical protein